MMIVMSLQLLWILTHVKLSESWTELDSIRIKRTLIPWNLEKNPLEIRSNGNGDGGSVTVAFWTGVPTNPAGGFRIIFSSPPRYQLRFCAKEEKLDVSPKKGAVWRLSRSDAGFKVQVDDSEVTTILPSAETCTESVQKTWNFYFSKRIGKIQFSESGQPKASFRAAKAWTADYKHCINSTELTEAQRLVLKEHNAIRDMHDIPPLCYSETGDDFSFTAESWAGQSAKLGTYQGSAIFKSGAVGENWDQEYSGAGEEAVTVVDALRNWAEQCELSEVDQSAIEKEQGFRSCAQMLWKSSRYLNCGVSKSTSMELFLVCQYHPPLALTQTEGNLPHSFGWTNLELGNNIRFDFSSSPLQIRTPSVATEGEQYQMELCIYQNQESALLPNKKEEIFRLEFTMIGSYRDAKIVLCNTRPVTRKIGTIFRSAPTITWTLEITEEGIEILANGEELAVYALKDIGAWSECLESWKELANQDGGRFRMNKLKTSLMTYRSLPSAILPPSEEYEGINMLHEEKKGNDDQEKENNDVEHVTEVHWTTEKPNYDEQKEGEYTITGPDGKKIRVSFPKVHVGFVDNTDGTVTAFIDHYEEFKGIDKFQLLLQHYSKDHEEGEEGGALSYKDTIATYQESIAIYHKDGRSVPYITAELPHLPDIFIIGDKVRHGGYFNGPLPKDRKYSLRVRGLIREKNEDVYIDTNVLGIFSSHWSAALGIGTCSVVGILWIGVSVSLAIRRHRKKQKVRINVDEYDSLIVESPKRGGGGGHRARGHGKRGNGGQGGGKNDNMLGAPLRMVKSEISEISEWWSVSDPEENKYTDEPEDHMKESETRLGAEVNAVTAAAALLNQHDKNIVRRTRWYDEQPQNRQDGNDNDYEEDGNEIYHHY